MKRGEKGFTLIETLLAIAITGTIIGPLWLATTTLLTNPQQTTDEGIVLQQVRNAGYWMSRDVQTARRVNPTDPDGFPLTLSIPVDTDENNDYRVDYLFDGNRLKRELYDSLEILVSETSIAYYIETGNTTFDTLGSSLYKLTIRASKGDAAVTRSYEVGQRLSGSS